MPRRFFEWNETMTSIVNGVFSGESKPDVISRSRMHLREGVKMLRVTTRRGSVENGFMDSNFLVCHRSLLCVVCSRAPTKIRVIKDDRIAGVRDRLAPKKCLNTRRRSFRRFIDIQEFEKQKTNKKKCKRNFY